MTNETDLESLEGQLNDERRKVDVSTHNFSVRELVRMMSEDELNVAPSYQRKFRWTDENESLFIESVLLGLPIPPIFVATNVGFQWEVVDGLQRLSTMLHFMASTEEELLAIDRRSPLKIAGLEKLSQLNGQKYEDFPKSLKVYFGRQPLQVISLTDKSDKQVRFDLFERLNRGSVSLTAQEVRACVFRGPFNDFLDKMALNSDFASLVKLQEGKTRDGTREEQVLKFFAYKNFRQHYDGKVEKFLNRYMVEAQDDFDMVREEACFVETVATLARFRKGRPFLRAKTPVTPLVQLEACLVAIAELSEQGVDIDVPDEDWLEDPELVRTSTAGSNTRAMLSGRIDRAKALLSGSAR